MGAGRAGEQSVGHAQGRAGPVQLDAGLSRTGAVRAEHDGSMRRVMGSARPFPKLARQNSLPKSPCLASFTRKRRRTRQGTSADFGEFDE